MAANLDSTVPTPRGLAPGNGQLVAVISRTTGRTPEVAGKPELALHREAVRRTGARRPLVVGDRLDTDIEGANRAGVPSLLVLTGVATPGDVVAAQEELRPSYVAGQLASGLLEPHPPVTRDSRGWVCGDATVSSDGTLTGEGIDVLRAACLAAWSGEVDADRLVAGLGKRKRGGGQSSDRHEPASREAARPESARRDRTRSDQPGG